MGGRRRLIPETTVNVFDAGTRDFPSSSATPRGPNEAPGAMFTTA